MPIHELAGKPAPKELLTDIPGLLAAYHDVHPDPSDPACAIAFGTSGHRGSSLDGSFNEDHILAVTQAVCEYRAGQGIDGPLFLGMDTHGLSLPALETALEVFAANQVAVHIQAGLGFTPTPVISHAILTWNAGRTTGLADGVVITPSHNPPRDGGYKYNPPEGGPAGSATTSAIQNRANELLTRGVSSIKRIPFERALKADCVTHYDYITPYVADLRNVVDVEAIAGAGLKIGVDPLGGSGIALLGTHCRDVRHRPGADQPDRGPDLFGFMTVDKDGKIRMDCSSPYAMASLIRHKDNYDIAFGNDPDYDRHGIVTRSAGLMNPNHYLAVVNLVSDSPTGPDWPKRAARWARPLWGPVP